MRYTDGLNPYLYVHNNPINDIDPLGLWDWGIVGEYFSEVGQTFKGEGMSVVNAVTGLASAVAHPVNTITGIGTAIAHPINTGTAIINDVIEKSQSSEGLGELAGDVLQTIAGVGLAKKASELARVGQIAKDSAKAADVGGAPPKVPAAPETPPASAAPTEAPSAAPANPTAAAEAGAQKTYYHYTNQPEESFANGLHSWSSVTDTLYEDPFTDSQELGIPPPNKVIPIPDKGQFIPAKPPKVDRTDTRSGGGTDFNNPKRVPPEDLGPAQPIPPG
jgi:hypothetical protein